MALGQGRRRQDSLRGAERDGGAAGQGGRQRGVDPDLDLRALRCSLEDPARGDAVGAEELAGARPEERRVAPIVGQESTGASRWSSWAKRQY
jgi:hypothetical protein